MRRFAMAGPVLALLLLLVGACAPDAPGRRGTVVQWGAETGDGEPIAGAELRFIAADRSNVVTATTDVDGTYEVALDPGRYVVAAGHPDFQDYTTSPGFVIVEEGGMGDFDVALRAPRATTVFVVRHAEKIHPDSNAAETPLSAEGDARAVALARVLDEVGIAATYATPTVRARNTVAALASAVAVEVEEYTDPAALVQQVLTHHSGDAVAVAGHSNTVGAIVAAFGGAIDPGSIGDYDNLYTVTIPVSGAASVVNLQFGEDTGPDVVKTAVANPTLLLVEADQAGALAQAEAFVHVLAKSAPTVLASEPGLATLDALAAALQTDVQVLSGTPRAAIEALAEEHPDGVMVVALGRAALAQTLRDWGETVPVEFTGDVGPLVVATMLESGPVVRHLRF